jgi:hypothetical protein
MSELKLQLPSRRHGALAESEQELLSRSGGAMVCLYSEDMAPLMSVAHGMQLPRAQIGLLGACFTSSCSNAFQLKQVRAGNFTISYRQLLGGRILAVVVLSACGGSTGSLLSSMLEQMHDSIWAALCLLVGEAMVLKMLQANRVSQLRKALKPFSTLFQLVLMGRTEVSLLTCTIGAMVHPTVATTALALRALEHAGLQLNVPGPLCACIVWDGKLVSWTRAWCEMGSKQCDGAVSKDEHGTQGRAPNEWSEVSSEGLADSASAAAPGQDDWKKKQMQKLLLLHLLATNVALKSRAQLLPVYGLPCLCEGRAETRDEAQTDRGGNHRLLLVGLDPGPLDVHGSDARDESTEDGVEGCSRLRLCVLVPADDSLWALPVTPSLDAVCKSLERALHLVLQPRPPGSAGCHLDGGRDKAHAHGLDKNGDILARVGEVSAAHDPQQKQEHAVSGGVGAAADWGAWGRGIHPWLRRVLVLRRRRGQQSGGFVEECDSASVSGVSLRAGLDLFWEVVVPDTACGVPGPGADRVQDRLFGGHDGEDAGGTRETLATPSCEGKREAQMMLRGIVEALDARAFAQQRGRVSADKVWRVRVCFGWHVVHGVWLRDGEQCLFALLRNPAPMSASRSVTKVTAPMSASRSCEEALHGDGHLPRDSLGVSQVAVGGEFDDGLELEKVLAALQQLNLHSLPRAGSLEDCSKEEQGVLDT